MNPRTLDAGRPAAVKPPAAGARRTILIVDDDPTQRVMLVHAFWDLDARFLQAANGHEVLDIVESEGCPDLIVMDSRMPGMSGPETVAALRARGCRSGLVLMSGNSDEFRRTAARNDGVVAVVEKPLDLHEFRRIVHRAIERPGS